MIIDIVVRLILCVIYLHNQVLNLNIACHVSLWSEGGLRNTSFKCDCNTRFEGANVHTTLVNSKALKYFDIGWSFKAIYLYNIEKQTSDICRADNV